MRSRKAVNNPYQELLAIEEWSQGPVAMAKTEIPAAESSQELQEEQLGKAATTVICWLYRMARSACRRSKIRAEYLPILEALERDPGVNLAHLAEQLGVHPTTVERQVDALEKNGCVISRCGPLNKKKARIAKLEMAGREELTRRHVQVGSELRLLAAGNCEREEFTQALERLLAVAQAAPR